jgi:hypothetical protein
MVNTAPGPVPEIASRPADDPVDPGKPAPTPGPDHERAAGFLAVVRGMIQHEDTLVNQRLTWMWTLQGLLFGAASFLWSKDLAPVLVIGAVGLASCVSIGYGIARGLKAIRELLAIAAEYKKGCEGYYLPPTIGARSKATEWLLPGYLIPWVMGAAWCALIACRLVQ